MKPQTLQNETEIVLQNAIKYKIIRELLVIGMQKEVTQTFSSYPTFLCTKPTYKRHSLNSMPN